MLFHARLQVLVKELSKMIQRNLNQGKEIQLQNLVDAKTISSGLVFVLSNLSY